MPGVKSGSVCNGATAGVTVRPGGIDATTGPLDEDVVHNRSGRRCPRGAGRHGRRGSRRRFANDVRRTCREKAGNLVTLPVHRGTSQGRPVWYVVRDASTSEAAANRSTSAPVRLVVPGPPGFPPAAAPGAVGETGYSPLVQLPDGSILNASHVATTRAGGPTRWSTSTRPRAPSHCEADGFSRNVPVKYLSTDASDPGAAALEDVTFAPALNAAPFADGDGTDSARAGGRPRSPTSRTWRRRGSSPAREAPPSPPRASSSTARHQPGRLMAQLRRTRQPAHAGQPR